MNRWKKVALAATTILMAATMTFSFAACGPDEPDDPNPGPDHTQHVDSDGDGKCDVCGEDMGEDPGTDPESDYVYSTDDQEIYDNALGEFYELYMEARDIVGSTDEELSERYARMAIAEAKLLQSGVFSPLTSNGGTYAISRVAPHTVTSVLWGSDMYRYNKMLVTQEFIASSDREHINQMYTEATTNGTDAAEYNASVRAYLEEQGYHIKDSYNMAYNQDPKTYDVLATQQAVDNEVLVKTYDGLMEYDELGVLQPALADSYTLSEDKLTYTFHIRDDAAWYTQSGDRYAAITADDFVAGFQHLLDAEGSMLYLVQGVVKGVNDYAEGAIDFDEVGVKQVNENGEPDSNGEYVQYTLEQETPYFMTMMGYSVFAPMNRAYFLSQGGAFGADYNSSAADYTYGKSPSNILYSGPYRITNQTNESTIVFSAYEGYYDYDNLNLKTITWLFNDGQNATRSFTDARDGVTDGTGLGENTLVLAREQTTTDVHGNTGTYFDLYNYVSSNDASTGLGFYNLNRHAFANFNDSTVGVSPKDEVAKAVTRMAMQNVHFRRAIAYAFDRETYNTARSGADLALNNLINSYTPGNFVSLPADLTIDINGTATTFEAGTYYGEILQAQLTADGSHIKAWDPEKEDTVTGEMGTSFGFDGWYNPEAAKEEMAIAIEQLNGLTLLDDEGNPVLDASGNEIKINISADNPVQIDTLNIPSIVVWNNQFQAYKQTMEAALDEIQINLVNVDSETDWYYSSYFAATGAEKNFDFDTSTLWAPDYGDPQTYLDTLTPTGYMVMGLGLW